MIRVLIVDDEPLARQRLRRLLTELPEAEVAGEAGDGATARVLVETLRPDLVLLDIRMPGEDGLEVAKLLGELAEPPVVVFTTAFSEHALAAFEVEAADYLVKPIRREKLQRALARAAERLKDRRGQPPSISVHHRGGVHLIPLDDVFYFQADAKYVTAFHRHGEALLELSLKALEDQFGEALVRIHRNALVARARLRGIERDPNGGYRAILEGTDRRPEISRRLASEVRQRLEGVSA